MPYFFNQWELGALNLTALSPYWRTMDAGETGCMGYPEFAQVGPPDFKAATDRPVYGALNVFRISGGNPLFGSVATVFRGDFVGEQITVTPTHSGLWEMHCNSTRPDQKSGDCAAAPPDARGTLTTPAHLLLHNWRYWNGTQADPSVGAAYVEDNAARMTVRLLGANYNALLNLTLSEVRYQYPEANPALTLTYPGSVRLQIASFDQLFGTPEGESLRNWCAAQGWVLAWAPDQLYGYHKEPPGALYPSKERLLDPAALAVATMVKGVVIPPAATASFDKRWSDVNATRAKGMAPQELHEFLNGQWLQLWDAASPSLAAEPATVAACPNVQHGASSCAGVLSSSRRCLCP